MYKVSKSLNESIHVYYITSDRLTVIIILIVLLTLISNDHWSYHQPIDVLAVYCLDFNSQQRKYYDKRLIIAADDIIQYVWCGDDGYIFFIS